VEIIHCMHAGIMKVIIISLEMHTVLANDPSSSLPSATVSWCTLPVNVM